MSDRHMALTAALVALARVGIPPDIQELLVQGKPMRGIAPGALATALAEAEREGMRRAAEICHRIDDQCGMEAGLAAACAESILSEAGVAVTDK